MLVNLTNIGTGSVTSDISVENRATVSDVFEAAEITMPANAEFYVNRRPASSATVLSSGDSVQYSTVDVKGATEEKQGEEVDMDQLRQMTYDDVINSGNKEVPDDQNLWEKVFSDRLKASRKSLESVGAQIFDKLEVSMLNSNNDVAALEKRLKVAKEKNERLRFATKRFMKENNIAAPLAAMGLKEDAAHYFRQIGVPVPDAKSSVWHTSETDGKTEESA